MLGARALRQGAARYMYGISAVSASICGRIYLMTMVIVRWSKRRSSRSHNFKGCMNDLKVYVDTIMVY